ncbi:type I 3-dehydroquinate dehydratase [Leuconostoc suionicum]|uniref:type I 3-dehydroquinate dehydratase n=1 Tax=Leuconostoc suionicum TaxID=1511761 RepID=UPI001B8CFB25|nr:type I 3-dehydroquinate dehydratase [Leuconostoc suionicum]MBS1008264.1 type I 3-dehydroquinate dehydratase [Leuconostoc suionicum]
MTTLRELLKIPGNTDKPIIAVPLTLGPTDKFSPFAQKLQQQNPDIVEWRADYIADDFSQAVMWQQVKSGAQNELAQKEVSAMTEAKMLSEIDNAKQEFMANWPQMNAQIIKELTGTVFNSIGGFPVILTYRTVEQGGKGEMSAVEYATFVISALHSGYPFAAVDVEYTLDEPLRKSIMEAASQVNVPVILSYHDFNSTPKILNKMIIDMSETAADIIKLAVTPKTEADVQYLLDVTHDSEVPQPLITMSMGELGKRTRVEGYQYGSELTFATLNGSSKSAPGQLTINELLQAWQ